MSDSNGPVRRRRIAGEGKAAVPGNPVAKKAPVKKAPVKKAPVKKAPVKKTAAKKASLNKVSVKKDVPKAPIKTVAPRQVAVASVARSPAPLAPRVAKTLPPPVERTVEKRSRLGMSRPPSSELRWLVPAVLITVASLVLGAVLTVRGIAERRADGNVDSSNSQAAASARKAVATIFSFRYDKLDEHQAKSTALMTRSFAKKFDATVPALKELAPQRKIVTQAVAREAAAIECGSDCSSTKATILVFYDQVRIAAGSKEPTVFGNRITVSMVKQSGTWLVADIRAL